MNPGNILVAGVILILAQTVNSNLLTLLDGGLEQFQTTRLCHDYVVIGVASEWQAALDSCKRLGYDNLIWFGTELEMIEVQDWLDRFGQGQTYWMDGEYDNTNWRWWDRTYFPSWAPWVDGEPINSPLYHVAIDYINRFDARWLTKQGVELHKYICKRVVPGCQS